MPIKKDGMLFELHPTPKKSKDGKNILYARPAMRTKLTMKGLEDFCCRNYHSRYGELTMAFDYFMRAAAELMSMGYRIDTPIGSFAPKLKLMREITDPDEVKGRDVKFDGVEYNPGKRWNEELRKWSNGFRYAHNPDTQAIMDNKDRLEQLLRECLERYHGYVTTGLFASYTGLSKFSARKQLNAWTEGENPILLVTKRGKEHIYTEI